MQPNDNIESNKDPSTPTGRLTEPTPRQRLNSSDSNSSPGGRSSHSSSPGSYVFRRGSTMLGKLSSKKKIEQPPQLRQAWAGPRMQAPPPPRLSMRTPKLEAADNAFLRNLRSGSGEADGTSGSVVVAATHSLTPTRDNTSSVVAAGFSDADSDFLRALRGDQERSNSKHSVDNSESVSAAETSSNTVSDTNRSDADSAFLRALRGESSQEPAAPAQQSEPTFRTDPTLPNKEHIKQPPPPADHMAYANAAFLGALHASADPPDDALPIKGDAKGTFVLDSNHPKLVHGQTSGSGRSDADSAFLLAMRESSTSSNQPASFGGTAEFGNSGTLVLNGPAAKGRGKEESSFVMSIQSSEDIQNHLSREDMATKDELNAVSETDDDEDDDMEGFTVPSHPYVEKVMLPRPLFFGHTLPPRILEEAKLAAKIYLNKEDGGSSSRREWLEKDAESSLDSAIHESEEDSIFTKSSISTYSTSMGGKLFESNLSPCARNFEGALEVFGFGQNPFSSSNDINNPQQDEDTIYSDEMPKAPHPYISIYAPVWGDRARADRARTRRKRAKLADASAATMRGASFRSSESVNRLSCRSEDGNTTISNSFHRDFRDDFSRLTAQDHTTKSPIEAHDPENPSTSTIDVTDSNDFSRNQFSMFARAGTPTVETTNDFSRDQFCTFARGDDAGGTFVRDTAIETPGGSNFVSNQPKFSVDNMDSSTFVQAVKYGDAGSDDDSIEAAEERKAVGLNDNMAAAAAMLAGEEVDYDGDDNDQCGIRTSLCNKAAGGGAKAANKYGRPYSNFELTGGCVPWFSCDDPSLPHESDLGVFETKEDEKRTNQRRREKNIIENLTVPGIMTVPCCPTQCTDVDDSHSWNSREEGVSTGKANNTVLVSLHDGKSPTSPGSPLRSKAPTYEASRVGWWNLPDGFEETSIPPGKIRKESKKRRQNSSPTVDVFPALDDPITLDVVTNLWPSPQVLRNNNISAARLHSATSSARFLPHLSDRNPNFRHLQIDTTAVGFPKLGGEIEPMFCKLAIYHFEMNAVGSSSDRDIDESVASTISSGASGTSQPNRDRCGPVTEVLNFDVVQDPDVIENCKRALWPYASKAELGELPGGIGESCKIDDNVILEGSPCGIFPLPSHLQIPNLYAVLLVHKVVSDSSDQQPYFKPSRRDKTSSGQKEETDLTRLRENASKAAEQYGQLITPIAFGVLPLMEIVGNEESPKVPVTRVVQIPLFKFEQGRGMDIILDHILGMLHPRAIPKVGKIASLTRGHAFLVMRYYGFLGLHSIISKTKMARNRLVDFTRELQVKRQGDTREQSLDRCPDTDPYVVPPWRPQYVVEPAPFGGRCISTKPRTNIDATSNAVHESTAVVGYAQELAALPLENSVVESKAPRRSCRSSSANKFDFMFMHTSFCNELICHPRILTECPKKNVVIKIELREICRIDSLKVDAALPLKPSIHNPRRGPWLVQEAYTSCALKAANPQFLDEFKIKLPLILGESGRVIGLFFSVYHVCVEKRKGSAILQPIVKQSNQQDSDTENKLEYIGSGVLPLTSDESHSCLLSNGEHEVPIEYRVIDLGVSADRAKLMSPSSKQQHPTSSIGSVVKQLPSLSWTNEDLTRTLSRDTISTDEEFLNRQQVVDVDSLSYPAGTVFLQRIHAPDSDASADHHDLKSIKSDSVMNRMSDFANPNADGSSKEWLPSMSSGNLEQLSSDQKSPEETQFENELILKVNIIAFSSVHPQNRILSDFFLLKPDRPRCVVTDDFSGLSPWGKHRSEILYRLKPERIPPFNFVGGALAETERKLLEPVVSLSKTSKCPAYDVIPHLIRVITQLWRTMVSGIGEPSILWASPQSLIPLRLNAFASLLHVVSSASHNMAKAGLRLLDGDTKWNITALSKTLSLLFDESRIFDGPLEDPVQGEEARSRPTKAPQKEIKDLPKLLSKKPPKIARSKTSNAVSTPKPEIIQRFSSEEMKIPMSFDVDAMLQSSSAESIRTKEKLASASSAPLSSRDRGVKVDTRNDFMSAMREAAASEGVDEIGGTKDRFSSHLLNSFGSLSSLGPTSNRRRWMTLPAMATIQESDTEDNRIGTQESSLTSQSSYDSDKKGHSLDAELIVHGEKSKPKQFRVPQVTKVDSTSGISSFLDVISSQSRRSERDGKDTISLEISENKKALRANDDDIESAGTAFLNKISQSMGLLNDGKEKGGEELRVGAAHHRKTRSRCSIDWTLPPTDKLLEKDQQIEQLNRTKAGVITSPVVGFSPIVAFPDDASTDDDTLGDEGSVIEKQKHATSSQLVHPLKNQSRDNDRSAFLEPFVLPDFADRMNAMKDNGKPLRWWPYVYEVIIYQWLALLIEQTKKEQKELSKSAVFSPIVVKYLSHAAKAARGATIRCAPYLLEIIKQSLSWRIDVVFRNRKKNLLSSNDNSSENNVPQLVKLDANILTALEKLVTMLTDASIDSRNFDSFEFRKISTDVNDAVVRFLRDLFSMLDVRSVHRLVMVYFSRFVTKEGKHWHDRDSKTTGLRCSWETTKLRLNAITLFVRFPDFMKVNMPLMERERWEASPAGSSNDSSRRFFTGVLEKISRFGLSEITSSEGPISKEPITIPKLTPHWLAELCTDICLSATGHAEEAIQHRASSLLFELFWTNSQEGRASGNVSIVASVFVPFVQKVLSHVEYLSSFAGKCQLRKDIIPCVLFVLQSAPVGLMRALWRKLSKQAEGKTHQKDSASKYGGIIGTEGRINPVETDSALTENSHGGNKIHDDSPDIYDMFGLLNLALSTIEYEGIETKKSDSNRAPSDCEENPVWRKEFLLSADCGREQIIRAVDPRRFPSSDCAINEIIKQEPSTNNLRRWHAHDCSMVIIHNCRQIVREILVTLKPSINSDTESNESIPTSIDFQGSSTFDELFLAKTTSSSMDNIDAGHLLGSLDGEKDKARRRKNLRKLNTEILAFTMTDTVIFVRAATSVYLHALTMRQSDVVVVKTLTATIEIVKIFGIKVFLNAVGETLQHWIRVTLEHCGARRTEVRVDASEFLNLLLRLTWDCYGSFFRIRLPLLSVQTEVMERIVAKATSKFEKEQKALRLNPVKLSTESAEASLAPLWRTIDRIHFQSASLNLSFKSALARLAIMMKKLYKAYLAVHALNILSQSAEIGQNNNDVIVFESSPYVQKIRVSVHRIVSNAAGYSRQLLGNQASAQIDLSSIQSESVEDSLFTAADVFSSTELPSHRYAFLEKLAEFHNLRGRYAEEATCRLHIYHTYREAAKQHAQIWSSSPFLPWVSHQSEGLQSTEEPAGGAIASDIDFEIENSSVSSDKYIEKNPSFRRIFYRAADSVLVRTGDWEGFGGGKFLFYGVTLKSEFTSRTAWFTLRQLETAMVKEAEIAGDLFLKAGIVESSRHAWNLCTNFYSETFNYARLARAYERLGRVVTSKIPSIDTSNQFDMSSQIGRFYKVYFHGGAPDDLLHSQGAEGFIYRVPSSVGIKEFASGLENSVRAILPAKSTVDLLLDDGSPTMAPKTTGGKRQAVIGGAPIEPIKIKVTPLRPLFKMEDTEKCFRGTPEWFQLKTDEYDFMMEAEGKAPANPNGMPWHQRQISLSTANTLSSSGSTTISNRRLSFLSSYRNSRPQQSFSTNFDKNLSSVDTIGVDRFYFTQPAKRDPVRGFRDWLKAPTGSFAERSLRVTELQVEGPFPACVTRQKIIHRAIFSQSPLEAGVEAVSTWCSLLFRTIMATNGLRVLNDMTAQEDGLNIICIAKVLADCIHSSGVKQIGLSFLSANPQADETNIESGYYSSYERLSEEEIEKVQTKLARIIVIFLELLHLLIARNRDVLLAVVQARKRRCADAASTTSGSHEGNASTSRLVHHNSPIKIVGESGDNDVPTSLNRSSADVLGKSITTTANHATFTHKATNSDRTDAAIGVQSELQRGFISLVRSLSPNLLDTINTEVPRWMRQCCQDNYFSSGFYRQADIPIGDELFFNSDTVEERGGKDDSSLPISITRGSGQRYSPGNSVCGTEVSDGRKAISVQSTTHPSRHRETTSGSSHSSRNETTRGGF